MRRTPCFEIGDRLTPDYFRSMIVEPFADDLRRLRLGVLPTGFIRRRRSKQFNEEPVTIQAVVSRTPLVISAYCPAMSGIGADGDYLECEPFECEVKLPARGEFELHLVRQPIKLPEEPVPSPVLLADQYLLSAGGGGLAVARGSIGAGSNPCLDPSWLPPTATVSGSKAVVTKVNRLRDRLLAIDRTMLACSTDEKSRLLLCRFSACHGAWRMLDPMTWLDDFLSQTEDFLERMLVDTRAIFGPVNIKAVHSPDSLASAFRNLELLIDSLAATWQSLLSAPFTNDLPICEQNQKPAGNHNEIVLRTQGPIEFDWVRLSADLTGVLSARSAGVPVDLHKPHTHVEPRAVLASDVPGKAACVIELTTEEKSQGTIRLFVRRELSLASIALEGVIPC